MLRMLIREASQPVDTNVGRHVPQLLSLRTTVLFLFPNSFPFLFVCLFSSKLPLVVRGGRSKREGMHVSFGCAAETNTTL